MPPWALSVLMACLPAFGGEASFFDPAFEKLDAAAIAKLPASPVTELFAAEAETLDHHPHAAAAHHARLRELCTEKPTGRAGYACAMGLGPGDYLAGAREGDTPGDERDYAEGRISGAVMPFAMLTRTRAETSLHYWLGRAHWRKGNHEAARETFRNAPAGDRRIAAVFRDGELAFAHERYGCAPGIFYTPARGLGAQLRIFDDAIWDTARAASLTLMAATRDTFGIWDDYRQEWVGWSGGYFDGNEDFYGFGPGTAPAHSGVRSLASRAEIYAHREWGGFRARLGAKLARTRFLGDDLTYFGPRAEVGWRGITLAAFSTTRFTEVTLEARETVEPWHDGWLAGTLVTRHVDGAPPLGELSRFGGSFSLPGVREGRFRDRELFGVSAEYLHRVWWRLRVGAFGVAGTVAPDYGGVFRRWEAGGGLAIDPGDGARLEVSRFGGEWTLLARVTAEF